MAVSASGSMSRAAAELRLRVSPAPTFATPQPDDAVVGIGADRTLLLTPDSGELRGLAVELHGSGLDPRRQLAASGLAGRLLPLGIGVLLPCAGTRFRLRPDLAEGFAWHVPNAPLPGALQVTSTSLGDVERVERAAAAALERIGCPETPLLMVGYSGGARLAAHVVATGALRWRAAALVAGLRAVSQPYHTPPPTIAFHGMLDGINPPDGGAGPRWEASVVEAADGFASAQGCAPGCREQRLSWGRRRVYASADGEPNLILHLIDAAAHAWPGSSDEEHLRAFGPAGGEIDASELIADFLSRHVAKPLDRDLLPRRPTPRGHQSLIEGS